MAHTKKKMIGNLKVDFKISETDFKKNPKTINSKEFDQAFLQTEDNKLIAGFVFTNNKKVIVVPEPEPSILYFTSAENNIDEILKLQSEILDSKIMGEFEKIKNKFFSFFQLSTNLIINLFASIEAFNNSQIPKEYTFKEKRRTYDRNKIQRFIKFDVKVKKILPEIFDKSFAIEHSNKFEVLMKMKDMRDNVIHTKNYSEGFLDSYRGIYRSYLSFDFEMAFNYTKDYMNFYKTDWIENCDCGN
jgi:hypothetical protein